MQPASRIVIERDPILRILPVILDPATPVEHRRAIADFLAHDVADFEGWLNELRRRLPGLYPAQALIAGSQDELRALLAGADGLVVEGLAVGEAELSAAPDLAFVQCFGTLAPAVDLEACARRGVPVDILRRRVNISVGEHAIALMLALAHRLHDLDGCVTEARLRAAGFDPTPFDRRYAANSNFGRVPGLRTLSGAVLGAVGLGEVGREVACRARGLGMRILYHQRNRLGPVDEAALGVAYCGLDALLERSDVVSLHLPLNKDTEGFLGRREFDRMKPGALLINVARAGLVDHDALVDALAARRLGGLGLDVGYHEPSPPDEPLLGLANVVLTPHTAVGDRMNSLDDMAEMCLKMWRRLSLRHHSKQLPGGG